MMDCQICKYVNANVDGLTLKYNNCVIECLERIKLHYSDMLKKFGDNNLVIRNLQESNSKLQAKMRYYERGNGEKPLFKLENDGSESYSEVLENEILNKTVDSLNVALNDESDFEISYVSDSPDNLKNQKLLKREPMKPITSADDNTAVNSKSICARKQGLMKYKGLTLLKENKSCLLKNTSRKNDRSSQERSKLSIKSNHLRQRRLQVDAIKKSLNRDFVFDQGTEETIYCNSVSSINKSSAKAFHRQHDSQDDNIFEFSSPSQKKIITKGNSIIQQNETETPSVMILTPETQDIIFLDDTCDSNIESMDLVSDFVRPSDERLKNLKILESNRIKLLQKTASTKTTTVDNDFEKSNKNDCTNVILKNLEETNIIRNKLEETNMHVLKEKTTKDKRLLTLNCDECQKYIKYLGARLSDEEIEKHLRNCTKHKLNIETPSTPDGFWDPKIKPLDKDDPRNKTLIDTRFLRK